MELRPEASRYRNERRTSLRLFGRVHSQRPKSFWRLYREAEPRRADPERRSDQGSWFRLLNMKQLKMNSQTKSSGQILVVLIIMLGVVGAGLWWLTSNKQATVQ